MKKCMVVVLSIFCFLPSFAKTITVSNNPNSPGQYVRLDSAINAASAGDILLISGSTTNYSSISGGTTLINKAITLLGQGYDPRKDAPLPTTLSNIHIVAAGSGATISGFAINAIYEDGGTNNITISRCSIVALYNPSFYTNGINGNNYNIRENIIGSIAIGGGVGGILIQNNIITGNIAAPASSSNITITNNYFSAERAFSGLAGLLYNAAIYNNIFYYKKTTPSASYSSAQSCVFKNNIYFNTSNTNPLNIGINNNSGSGNINANPDFVNIVLTTTGITRADNFNLSPGSPGINAGTDSLDIGPHGGSVPMQYPYSGEPAIPQIKTMDILNPVIPPNGTLKVHFKAKTNN